MDKYISLIVALVTLSLNYAICKSRNGESGNGMRGMMRMRGIRL